MDRYNKVKLGAWIGIIGNAFLSVAKLLVGIIGRSSALIADGVHTFSDVGTSLIVLFGAGVAGKPRDEKHPYGHGRAESMAAQVIAILLIVSAAIIAWNSIGAVIHPTAETAPSYFAFWVALASVAVKEAMYQYKIRLAREVGSLSIKADAWHHRSDAISSAVAVIGIGGSILGGPSWGFLDPLAACAIAVMIFLVGVGIFRKTVSELMDESPDAEVVEGIKKVAASVADVSGIEIVRVRKSGLDLLVEIHVEVSPDMSVRKSHEVATKVKETVIKQIEAVKFVLVHIEPFYPGDH